MTLIQELSTYDMVELIDNIRAETNKKQSTHKTLQEIIFQLALKGLITKNGRLERFEY